LDFELTSDGDDYLGRYEGGGSGLAVLHGRNAARKICVL